MLQYLVRNKSLKEYKTEVNGKRLKINRSSSKEKKKEVSKSNINLSSKEIELKHWTDDVKPGEFISHKDTFGQTSGGLRSKFLLEACAYSEETCRKMDEACLCWVIDKLFNGNTRVTCKQFPCKSNEELQSFFFRLCVGIPSYETFNERLCQEIRFSSTKRRFLQLWTDVERTRSLIIALLMHQIFVKNVFVLKQNIFDKKSEFKAQLVAIHEHPGMEGLVREIYKVMTWLFRRSCIDVVLQKTENCMMFEFCAYEGHHILYHKGHRLNRYLGKRHNFNVGDPIPLEFVFDDISTKWRLKANLFSHFAAEAFDISNSDGQLISNISSKKQFSRIGAIDKIGRPLPGFGSRRGIGVSSKNCWSYEFEHFGIRGKISDYCSLYTIFTFYPKVFVTVIQMLVVEFLFGEFPKSDS
jgi:hypothetical protein